MNKAILVIDIPDDRKPEEYKIDRIWEYVPDEDDDRPYSLYFRREKDMRFKPMPKELVYEGYESPNKQIGEAILQSEWGKKAKKNDAICIRSFSIGYNACLEEIQK